MLRPGRFDQVIGLPLPDEQARRAILQVHLRNKPVADPVSAETLAARSAGASGAQLAAVCNRAALFAIRREIESSPPVETLSKKAMKECAHESSQLVLMPTDFDAALAEILPDSSPSPIRPHSDTSGV